MLGIWNPEDFYYSIYIYYVNVKQYNWTMFIVIVIDSSFVEQVEEPAIYLSLYGVINTGYPITWLIQDIPLRD
jgi:hypothetical protein